MAIINQIYGNDIQDANAIPATGDSKPAIRFNIGRKEFIFMPTIPSAGESSGTFTVLGYQGRPVLMITNGETYSNVSMQGAGNVSIGNTGFLNIENGGNVNINPGGIVTIKGFTNTAGMNDAIENALLEYNDQVIPAMSVVDDVVVITDASELPLVSANIDIAPVWAGSGVPSPTNIRALSGRTSATLKHGTDGTNVYDTYTANFSETVYSGSFNFASKQLNSISAIVDMGDLITYPVSGQQHIFALKLPGNAKDLGAYATTGAYCSIYRDYQGDNLYDLANYSFKIFKATENIGTGFVAGDIGILVRDDRFSDVPNFSTSIQGQTLVYLIENPIIKEINLSQIIMHEGENTLWSEDSGDGLIEVTYWVNNLTGGTIGKISEEKLDKSGGVVTGNILTTVTEFTDTSLVTKQFVMQAIAAITDYESEVFPNG